MMQLAAYVLQFLFFLFWDGWADVVCLLLTLSAKTLESWIWGQLEVGYGVN